MAVAARVEGSTEQRRQQGYAAAGDSSNIVLCGL
jgi:hypothetical protein